MIQPQVESGQATIDAMIGRARAAMSSVADYDQARIDRLCQALGWATANEKTFNRIVAMSIEESRLGDPEGRKSKRIKILGVLRDALRPSGSPRRLSSMLIATMRLKVFSFAVAHPSSWRSTRTGPGC